MADETFEVALWQEWIAAGEKSLVEPMRARSRVNRFVKGGERQWGSDARAAWGGHRVVGNYMYPTVKVFLPHLVPRYPKAMILPRTAAETIGSEEALVLEEKLAYNWREGRYLVELRKAAHEALVGGIGWLRIAWDEERGIPEVRHRKPHRVVVDPEAEEELYEAGWVAEKITMRIADLKDNPFFKNVDRLDPKNFRTNYSSKGPDGVIVSQGPQQVTGGGDPDLISVIDIWLIWSRRGKGRPHAAAEGDREEPLGNNRLLCYAEGHDFWLHDGPWPLIFDHDEFPFRCLRFNYDPESFFAYGPMYPAVAAQEFVNFQLSFLLSHTKKGAAAKVVYDKNLINEEQLARIFNGKDYEAVAVDFLDGKKPFEVVDLQTDPTKIESTIGLGLKVMFDITGASELVMGGQGKTQSASEARIREQRVQNRIDDMRDQVKDFTIDVNRAIAMTDLVKTPVRSSGDVKGIDFFLGQEAIGPWERMKAMDVRALRAEVSFEIDAGTMRRPTREEQVQDLFGLFDRLGPRYMELGKFDALQKLVARVIRALELPEPQDLIPADLTPAGPPPEQVQAEQQMAQQAQQMQAQQAQMVEEQKQAQLQAAFQRVQQAIEQVRAEAGQGVMAARQEIQAAMQGFQMALQAQPAPGPATQIVAQGPVSVPTQQASIGAESVSAQITQMTTEAGSVEVGASEVVVPPPAAEAVPTVTVQEVERDALGRIARVVSRSEPAVVAPMEGEVA